LRKRQLWSLLSCMALLACGREEAAHAPTAVVEAVEVLPQPFAERLALVGQLSARESVVLRPEIAGVIESVDFEEGASVAAGAVLFVLRSEEQRAALREASAQQALALDVYERTQALSKVNVSAAAELKRARAEVDQAKAKLDLAQVELDRTRMRAPFDGVVGARFVSPGDRVDSDTDLAEFDAVDRLRLGFSLPEAAVGLARKGLVVSVVVAAFPKEHFEGEVYFVSPSLDPNSRRLPLKAWIPNADGRLRPGMFANVELETHRSEQALLVPDSAIAYDAAGSFVWRVREDARAERASVALGARQDGRVQVLAGIAPGDRIVVSGGLKLFPGIAVEVRPPAGPVAARDERP
jgi:membrane fusion protein, multidrug efflux system